MKNRAMDYTEFNYRPSTGDCFAQYSILKYILKCGGKHWGVDMIVSDSKKGETYIPL